MDFIVNAVQYALTQPVTLVTVIGAFVVASILLVRYIIEKSKK